MNLPLNHKYGTSDLIPGSGILHEMVIISPRPVKQTLSFMQYESYLPQSGPTNGATLGSYGCSPHLHTLFQIHFNTGNSKGSPYNRLLRPLGRYSSTLFKTSALKMGVRGQHHAPAALPPGKTRYPLYRRLGGLQGRSGRVREISPPQGFDPRTV